MTAPTPPPGDSRDARVEALAEKYSPLDFGIGDRRDIARGDIGRCEAAGLSVLLPDDATVERIALAEAEWWHGTERAMSVFPENWKSWLELDETTKAREAHRHWDRARAVLAALAERPSGGAG